MKMTRKVQIIAFLVCGAALVLVAPKLAADLIEDQEGDVSSQPVARPSQPMTPEKDLIGVDINTPKSGGERKGQQESSIVYPPKPNTEQKNDRPPTGASDRNRNKSAPIKFWGKNLTGDKAGGVIVLEEDVVVTQDDLRISADKATLIVEKLTNEVREVRAVGNVKFFRIDPETNQPVTADSKEASFDNSTRVVILRGDPKLIRGSDTVKGKQISYDLVTGWVKATRVEGVVQSPKSGQAGSPRLNSRQSGQPDSIAPEDTKKAKARTE
jgi:lipopolysaccharide export system protein LptA